MGARGVEGTLVGGLESTFLYFSEQERCSSAEKKHSELKFFLSLFSQGSSATGYGERKCY